MNQISVVIIFSIVGCVLSQIISCKCGEFESMTVNYFNSKYYETKHEDPQFTTSYVPKYKFSENCESLKNSVKYDCTRESVPEGVVPKLATVVGNIAFYAVAENTTTTVMHCNPKDLKWYMVDKSSNVFDLSTFDMKVACVY